MGNFTYFLEVDGVQGESLDSDHQHWVDVLSYEFDPGGDEVASATSGRRASKAVGRLTVTKRIDRASPPLIDHLLRGIQIPEITLDAERLTDGGSASFMTYKFLQCRVVSLDEAGDGDAATEVVVFQYRKGQIEYTSQAGSVEVELQ